MRVISGKAKRHPLRTIAGEGTRPTTDRIKETLFNILQNDLSGIRFLDLYAGSGAIGIEALSRGAASACFVENNRAAVQCIRENLAATGLLDQAEIFSCDVRTALVRLNGRDPFSIIFMDPPYHRGEAARTLGYIAKYRPSYADAKTLFIIEQALDEEESLLTGLGYEERRVKTYKTNKHLFLSLKTGKEGQL